MRATAAAITTVLLLGTAACSSGSDDPKPAPATAKASPSPTGYRALGTPWTWHDGTANGTTTVTSYQQPVPVKDIKPPQAGYEWAAAEVRVCNTRGDMFTVSQFPWSVAYKDEARMQPTSMDAPGFPQPLFPITDTAVKAGDCVRGNIVFAVPEGRRPERVVYAPTTDDGSVRDLAEWAVPAE